MKGFHSQYFRGRHIPQTVRTTNSALHSTKLIIYSIFVALFICDATVHCVGPTTRIEFQVNDQYGAIMGASKCLDSTWLAFSAHIFGWKHFVFKCTFVMNSVWKYSDYSWCFIQKIYITHVLVVFRNSNSSWVDDYNFPLEPKWPNK